MEKQFVPYELAVKLKELGFDEECMSFYNLSGRLNLSRIDSFNWIIRNSDDNIIKLKCVAAPLWQQAFDWFREYYGFTYIIDDYNIDGVIGYDLQIRKLNDFVIGVRNKVIWNSFSHSTFHEARHACLEKLIELITNKN